MLVFKLEYVFWGIGFKVFLEVRFCYMVILKGSSYRRKLLRDRIIVIENNNNKLLEV